MAPSCDAVMYNFCRTRDLIKVFVRICSRSMEETVVRGVNVEGPSKSERTMQADTSTANTEEDDEPASLLAPVQLLPRLDSRINVVVQSAVEEMADDRSLASAGQGSSGRGMMGERRRRSIRQKRRGGKIYGLLRLCCIHGCNDKDVERNCP